MNTQSQHTFFATWPDEVTPGWIYLAAFDRRIFNPQIEPAQQLANALFFHNMPVTSSLNIAAVMIQIATGVANQQASLARERFYAKIASEHELSPTDPEQLQRLNAIISGFGGHDLDPTA